MKKRGISPPEHLGWKKGGTSSWTFRMKKKGGYFLLIIYDEKKADTSSAWALSSSSWHRKRVSQSWACVTFCSICSATHPPTTCFFALCSQHFILLLLRYLQLISETACFRHEHRGYFFGRYEICFLGRNGRYFPCCIRRKFDGKIQNTALKRSNSPPRHEPKRSLFTS